MRGGAYADRTRIVLDCGTGAHGLGLALTASAEHPLRGHLLITHTHWGVELERVSRAGTVVDALARVVAIEALYHAVTLALEAEAASLST